MPLLDRAKVGYARRLEEHYGGVASKPACSIYPKEEGERDAKVGWALKSRTQGRFNDKQKDFMTSKFDEGERTGNKHKAEEVAKEMRKVKDDSGKRIFTVDEFLTEQQISSFFSRLAAKRRQLTTDDISANRAEEMRKKVRDNVMRSLSSHPLTYEDLVLCDMTAGEVGKLKLEKIKAICNHLGVGPFPGKKKALHVEKLMERIGQCLCK